MWSRWSISVSSPIVVGSSCLVMFIILFSPFGGLFFVCFVTLSASFLLYMFCCGCVVVVFVFCVFCVFLAVSDLPVGIKEKVSVSDIEVTRSGPSFAIDTVEALQKNHHELFWIIGSDAYAKMDKWHRADELKEKVSFIVIDRPGDDGTGLDIGALDISATEIRKGQEFSNTSPSVRSFITERKLYAGK